jgi:hypothetical protein
MLESGRIDQFQFRLGRSCRSSTAFGDILPTGSSCLDHLIYGPGPGIQEFLTEPYRRVVDDRRGLERGQHPVTTARSQPFPRKTSRVSIDFLTNHNITLSFRSRPILVGKKSIRLIPIERRP